MAEFVVIRLGNETSAAEWILVDSNGTRRSNVATGTLTDAARSIGTRAVIVLVPATDVLTTSVKIPVRSAAKIRAALPFALEESIADDLETLHFAAGVRSEDGSVPVAIVAHEKINGWTARLAEAGIEVTRMISENQGLPSIPGTMSVLVDEHCTMFNDGSGTEFVMQDVKPSDFLVATGHLGSSAADDNNLEGNGHLVAFCSAQQDAALTHDWNALRHELSSVDVNILPDGVLPKLAATVASGQGINLLQGRHGHKTEYEALLRPWKTAALLLLGLILLAPLAKVVDNVRLRNEQAALQQQFTAQYRSLRPADTRDIADPVNTVNSLRRSFGATASPQLFLPSLRALGAALASNSGSALEVISYRAGVIDIRLTAPDVETLDRIQNAVGESGRFVAKIQSTDQVADKTNGRIQIRESGS
jgi:general secretion pathway protein L